MLAYVPLSDVKATFFNPTNFWYIDWGPFGISGISVEAVFIGETVGNKL